MGPFDVGSVADDVSSGGLHMRCTRRLEVGTPVFGLVTLPTGAAIAARGRVLRLDARGDALWSVAVQFSRARLIRSREASV